jgi:hypothetical protein
MPTTPNGNGGVGYQKDGLRARFEGRRVMHPSKAINRHKTCGGFAIAEELNGSG